MTAFSAVVALDGPSGTGKSTVARRLAQRLGAAYLDTGAMYRAATVAVLRAGVPLTDAEAVAATVTASRIEVSVDPGQPATWLDGEDVSIAIRQPETTQAVSAVSAVPAVRRWMLARQRELISRGPTVAEGRDIGSEVWPQAELKVYLTAREEVRAARRAQELGGVDVSAVAADIRRRDGLDSGRVASPLRRADGATELDTSDLDIDQVVAALVRLVQDALSGAGSAAARMES